MATLAEVARQEPEIAAIASRLWPGPLALESGRAVPRGEPAFAIAYLATVRRDVAPRLHPFCPILADGRLFAAIARRSPKRWDLRRDARCVIHATPGPDDDELCIRAVASDVTSDATTTSVVRAVVARSHVGGMIESFEHEPIFEFDIQRVDIAHWVDVGQPGTHAVREHWPRQAP
ncbi:MAG TPA: hypothetical protein VFT09_04665 [Ilumatobacteraceae bacterium]|nr:hypothetical protein [Ilumatobacteraceae bacterium]